jgi:hypothetical protein
MLLRLAVLVLFCTLVPRVDAQWRVPVNCGVPGHNGDCALYGLSMVQLLTHVTRCQRLP